MGVIVVGKSGDTYHNLGIVAADEGLHSFAGLDLYGGNGAAFKIIESSQLITCNGASDVTVGLVPAGGTVLAVDTKLVTALGGASTWNVGDGTDVDRWGLNIAASSNGSDYTAGGAIHAAGATEATLTYDVAANAGQVRVTAWYFASTSPTS